MPESGPKGLQCTALDKLTAENVERGTRVEGQEKSRFGSGQEVAAEKQDITGSGR